MSTPLNRRDFLALAGTALAARPAGAITPPAAKVEPVVGTQLYGWGQYYQREGRRLDDHLDEVLSAVRDAGFAYAEHGLDAGVPENNARFAERLRAKGLRPVSLYTGGRLHEAGRAEETVERLLRAARVARAAGFEVIVCNPDPIGREKTEDELAVQARALGLLGGGLNALGLKLGIHHHTPELAAGAREFHANFRRNPGTAVGFCYDVHWVFRGGLRPDAVLPEHGARVVSWHLRQSRDGVWWEDLDDGEVDYGWIAGFAREKGLPPRWTVELALEAGTKITRGVVENHRRSREYVRRVFGA
jgi:inosose dehydratase